MRRHHPVVAVIVLCVLATGHADHLRKAQRARGKPDLTLAGVSLSELSLSQLNKRFGLPQRVTDTDVYWIRSGVNIHAVRDVMVSFENGEAHSSTDPEGLSLLAISGRGACPLACTGRGLRLGGSKSDLVQLYGSRFAENQQADGRTGIALGWDEDVSLLVEIDAKGRIVEISLFQLE